MARKKDNKALFEILSNATQKPSLSVPDWAKRKKVPTGPDALATDASVSAPRPKEADEPSTAKATKTKKKTSRPGGKRQAEAALRELADQQQLPLEEYVSDTEADEAIEIADSEADAEAELLADEPAARPKRQPRHKPAEPEPVEDAAETEEDEQEQAEELDELDEDLDEELEDKTEAVDEDVDDEGEDVFEVEAQAAVEEDVEDETGEYDADEYEDEEDEEDFDEDDLTDEDEEVEIAVDAPAAIEAPAEEDEEANEDLDEDEENEQPHEEEHESGAAVTTVEDETDDDDESDVDEDAEPEFGIEEEEEETTTTAVEAAFDAEPGIAMPLATDGDEAGEAVEAEESVETVAAAEAPEPEPERVAVPPSLPASVRTSVVAPARPAVTVEATRIEFALSFPQALIAGGGLLAALVLMFVIGYAVAPDAADVPVSDGNQTPQTPPAGGQDAQSAGTGNVRPAGNDEGVLATSGQRSRDRYYLVIQQLSGLDWDEAERIRLYCERNGVPAGVVTMELRNGECHAVWGLLGFRSDQSEQATNYARDVEALGQEYRNTHETPYDFRQPRKNGQFAPDYLPGNLEK